MSHCRAPAGGGGEGCLVRQHVSVSAGVCTCVSIGGLPLMGASLILPLIHVTHTAPLVLMSPGFPRVPFGGSPKQRRQTPGLLPRNAP